MTWLKILLEYAVQPAIIITAVAWIIRSLTSQALTKGLEKYKASLQIATSEHSVQYKHIYNKRAEIIAELYSLIVDTELTFTRYISPWQIGASNPEVQRQEAGDAGNAMQDFYVHKRIFFEESLATEIDKLMDIFRESWHKFEASHRNNNNPDTKLWDEAWNNLQGPIKTSKQRLEKEFRSLLGINNE